MLKGKGLAFVLLMILDIRMVRLQGSIGEKRNLFDILVVDLVPPQIFIQTQHHSFLDPSQARLYDKTMMLCDGSIHRQCAI